MSDRCPFCASTDIADIYYPRDHKFTMTDKAQVCLDCEKKWGRA